MTLSQLADYICNKVRLTDANAVTRCKQFLRARYELVYNETLWKDSLYLFPFTFTPNTTNVPESWDATKMMPSVVDKVVGLRTSTQEVTAAAQEQLMRGDIDAWGQTGEPVQFATMAPVVAIIPSTYYAADAGIAGTVSAADAGLAWKASYIDGNGDRQTVSGTLPGSGGSSIGSTVRVLERVTKAVTANPVIITTVFGDETLVTIPAADTAAPTRIPVRLFPKPTAATAFSALVKKKVLHLEDDGDTPELRNVDQCLIAFAQADMWEYGRQIGKSNSKVQEAGALLAQLKALHTWQEQTLLNVAPEVGSVSGEVDSGLGGKSYW